MSFALDPMTVLETPRGEARALFQGAPFVVYAICDPVTGRPVYVGQTRNIGSRFRNHMRYWKGLLPPTRQTSIKLWLATLGRSPFIDRPGQPKRVRVPGTDEAWTVVKPDPWIAAYLEVYGSDPLMPKLMILDRAATREEILSRETLWIYHYAFAGLRLLNLSQHRMRVRQAWKRFPQEMVVDAAPASVSALVPAAELIREAGHRHCDRNVLLDPDWDSL